ncbi:MAG: Gfo/Idh/MocA family oxidoreductase [Nocardioidaceae bacterium]|nr:Gfo/Idh/MocA family oxidoreductase [Nocardioidaceae bacterium]
MTVRVGLVGTGYWARTVHAAGLAVHPDVELVGVWGRSPEKAEAAAPAGVTPYDDLDALLGQVDAVSFAVPPAAQAPLALRAAEAGKHLFLEKPIALDLAEADRLVEVVEARGLSTVVFFTQRFVPPWEEWLVAATATGPLGGHVDWLTSQGPDSPYFDSAWRREKNGALWDVGAHMLSQLLPALGPVVEVAGARGTGDLVHLVLTHEGGRTSTMSLSLSMPPGVVRVAVELYGEQGWMPQPAHERDLPDAHARAVSEWVANIGAGETRHRCDVRFGRDVVEVLGRCARVLG